MAGRSLAQCKVREDTGCNVIAVVRGGETDFNPDGHQPLPADAELIVIGDAAAEQRFLERFPRPDKPSKPTAPRLPSEVETGDFDKRAGRE